MNCTQQVPCFCLRLSDMHGVVKLGRHYIDVVNTWGDRSDVIDVRQSFSTCPPPSLSISLRRHCSMWTASAAGKWAHEHVGEKRGNAVVRALGTSADIMCHVSHQFLIDELLSLPRAVASVYTLHRQISRIEISIYQTTLYRPSRIGYILGLHLCHAGLYEAVKYTQFLEMYSQ